MIQYEIPLLVLYIYIVKPKNAWTTEEVDYTNDELFENVLKRCIENYHVLYKSN